MSAKEPGYHTRMVSLWAPVGLAILLGLVEAGLGFLFVTRKPGSLLLFLIVWNGTGLGGILSFVAYFSMTYRQVGAIGELYRGRVVFGNDGIHLGEEVLDRYFVFRFNLVAFLAGSIEGRTVLVPMTIMRKSWAEKKRLLQELEPEQAIKEGLKKPDGELLTERDVFWMQMRNVAIIWGLALGGLVLGFGAILVVARLYG